MCALLLADVFFPLLTRNWHSWCEALQ